MKNDSFEHIIKNKMDDIEIIPPHMVWDNIDNHLNKSARKRKLIIASISSFAASIIVALSFNLLISDRDISIEQTNRAMSINESIIELDNHIHINNSQALIPIKPLIVLNRNITKDTIEKIKLKSNNTLKSFSCPLDIKLETQNIIAYNNDKVTIYNNIASEGNRKLQPILGMNLSTSSSLSNTQSQAINNLSSYKTAEIPSTRLSNYIKIPKSEIKLHTNISISLELPIKKNFNIVTGVGYLGFRSRSNKGFYLGDINDVFTNETIIDKYKSDIKDIKHDFSYLEIPLTLKYSIISSRVSVYLNGGLGVDFLVSNKSKIILENGKSINNKTKDINNITYCSIGGLGISTRIFSSFYIKAEVQHRYYLNDISSNKALTIDKGMTSMSFGLSYKL